MLCVHDPICRHLNKTQDKTGTGATTVLCGWSFVNSKCGVLHGAQIMWKGGSSKMIFFCFSCYILSPICNGSKNKIKSIVLFFHHHKLTHLWVYSCWTSLLLLLLKLKENMMQFDPLPFCPLSGNNPQYPGLLEKQQRHRQYFDDVVIWICFQTKTLLFYKSYCFSTTDSAVCCVSAEPRPNSKLN